MILRLSNPTQRGILVAVAFALALSLSYFSIRNARAVYLSGLETPQAYERAAQLEPGDARNWYLLARYWQYNLEDPDVPRAIRAYRSAVSVDPRSAETWLDLGTAYESEGNLAAARDAFLHAKKDYPLSAEVSWRFGNFLLRQGELQPAFAEIRHAVEADPKRGAEAFSRCLRVEPDVEKILNQVLPPIRDVYVDVIWDQTTDGHTDNALKVWNRLVSIHPRLPLQDVFSLFGSLWANKQFAEASHVWDQAVVLAGMSDLQGPPDSIVWDGGFESGVTSGGFSWLLPESPRDLQISFDGQEKHSGNRSLRLVFDGKSNLTLNNICHYVPVTPSAAYRFSAWIQTRALTTDEGLRFQLHSLGTQDNPAVVTPDIRGSQPWTRIEVPWSSGKDVYAMQVCLVRFQSSQSDNKIQGTAWVDDVALVPESAERSNP
jgi:tetratricopeptide (TPR) repeat protein